MKIGMNQYCYNADATGNTKFNIVDVGGQRSVRMTYIFSCFYSFVFLIE